MIDTTNNLKVEVIPEIDPVKSDVKQEPTRLEDHLNHLEMYTNKEVEVWNNHLELIERTFMPVFS